MARVQKDRKTSGAPKRLARGFQRASSTTRGSVDRIAGKNGFAEADVLLRWAEIVGADHAAKCRPVKVRYGHRSVGATLIVQTDSARAPEIEHQKARIVQRVNQFYGYGAITHLKITQSTGQRGGGFAEDAAPFAGAGGEPTKEDSARAAEMTRDIADQGLRDALTRIGAQVLAQSRTRRTSSVSEDKDPT